MPPPSRPTLFPQNPNEPPHGFQVAAINTKSARGRHDDRLTNSHSLIDFQRNARRFIDDLNATKEPVLLTVNGKVQAVLVDPIAYQQMQQEVDRQRLVAAIHEAEQALQEKSKCPVKEVFDIINVSPV